MIGQELTTTADYQEIGPFGTPIQLLLNTDQPTFLQFARRIDPPDNVKKDEPQEGKPVRSKITWDLSDVPFPPGDFTFGRCYGVRVKTNGMTAATVFAIQVQKEDPEILTFNPST